jgi:chorismate dehydratase
VGVKERGLEQSLTPHGSSVVATISAPISAPLTQSNGLRTIAAYLERFGSQLRSEYREPLRDMLMAMRVGRVPYLDAEPFYFDMARRGIEVYELVPSALVAAAERGDIDAGPIPLADSFRLEDRFQPVAGFCIASVKHAGSRFLFSTVPIAELGGARIGIPDEASGAPRLLQVLLRLKYGVERPSYVSLQAAYDAFLLIGDDALRQRMGAPGFPYTYDLGAEWQAWTGLPCVFSRWMVRKDVVPRDMALLEDTLYVGLEEGVNAMYRLTDPREDLLMLPRDIVTHIQGLRYHMGLAEQRAIEQFRHYMHQLDSG